MLRHAHSGDAASIVALSERVQAALIQAGSLQEIGPFTLDEVRRRIAENGVYVLDSGDTVTGSVFLEPALQTEMWALPGERRFWFLSRLMIDPALRGHRLGASMVRALQSQIAGTAGDGLVLDCWAGNARLQAYYADLGFRLHGVFDEADYQIAVMVWW